MVLRLRQQPQNALWALAAWFFFAYLVPNAHCLFAAGPPVADVGIVGAGPAGLVLAHALHDRGISVRVFERRPAFTPVGAAVFMHPFAIHSLREVSPQLADQLLSASTTIQSISVRSLSDSAPGFTLNSLGDAERVLGAPFIAVRFWDMLCALRQGLPDDVFAFGHQLERFEDLHSPNPPPWGGAIARRGDGTADTNEGGVVLHFADESLPCARVRYLIDAGGIRSATRAQLIGDEPILRLRATYAVADGERVAQCLGDECAVPGEEGLAFLMGDTCSVTIANLKNGDVWWTQTSFSDDPRAKLTNSGETSISELLDSRYRSWPNKVKGLVRATREEQIIESTLAELDLSPVWGRGGVTLLGDAAHAQLPSLGLGVSTAFGDVAELMRQIDRRGLKIDALRAYERRRIPLCSMLQLMSRGMYMVSGMLAALKANSGGGGGDSGGDGGGGDGDGGVQRETATTAASAAATAVV